MKQSVRGFLKDLLEIVTTIQNDLHEVEAKLKEAALLGEDPGIHF